VLTFREAAPSTQQSRQQNGKTGTDSKDASGVQGLEAQEAGAGTQEAKQKASQQASILCRIKEEISGMKMKRMGYGVFLRSICFVDNGAGRASESSGEMEGTAQKK